MFKGRDKIAAIEIWVKTMKTREILTADEKAVSAALKEMKIKTLERHAQKILAQLGHNDYDAVMAAVIKIVPRLSREAGDRFDIVKKLIAEQLPAVSSDGAKSEQAKQDVLVRLTVVVMVIIAKKFTKIMKEMD